jgi:hypothetical protein
MAAKDKKDFTADDFHTLLLRESHWGTVNLYQRHLTDDGIRRLTEALERPDVRGKIKFLNLGLNDLSNDALIHLAGAKGLCAKLERLFLDDNEGINSLTPLVDAGVLGCLTHLSLSYCSLLGDAFPPQLCANLPALQSLKIMHQRNQGEGDAVTLSAEALSLLPGGCRLQLAECRVHVLKDFYNAESADESPDYVDLPTTYHRTFTPPQPGPVPPSEKFGSREGHTVDEILEHAGLERLERLTMVKPAKC